MTEDNTTRAFVEVPITRPQMDALKVCIKHVKEDVRRKGTGDGWVNEMHTQGMAYTDETETLALAAWALPMITACAVVFAHDIHKEIHDMKPKGLADALISAAKASKHTHTLHHLAAAVNAIAERSGIEHFTVLDDKERH